MCQPSMLVERKYINCMQMIWWINWSRIKRVIGYQLLYSSGCSVRVASVASVAAGCISNPEPKKVPGTKSPMAPRSSYYCDLWHAKNPWSSYQFYAFMTYFSFFISLCSKQCIEYWNKDVSLKHSLRTLFTFMNVLLTSGGLFWYP